MARIKGSTPSRNRHKKVPTNAPNVPSYDFLEPGHLCLPKLIPTIEAAASPIHKTDIPHIWTAFLPGKTDKSFVPHKTGRPQPRRRCKCVKISSPLSRSSIKSETYVSMYIATYGKREIRRDSTVRKTQIAKEIARRSQSGSKITGGTKTSNPMRWKYFLWIIWGNFCKPVQKIEPKMKITHIKMTYNNKKILRGNNIKSSNSKKYLII